MPTLQLRSMGSSYLIEGLGPSGIDAGAFRDGLAEAYGVAVAVISTPRRAEPQHGEADGPVPIDAMIVDRRAESWEGLRDRIERWVRDQGFSYANWTGGGTSTAEDASATLHFHA